MVRWEKIDSVTSRLIVPNGWIVRTLIIDSFQAPPVVHQIFVPDTEHIWDIHDKTDEE
jgi:hypothetical protein